MEDHKKVQIERYKIAVEQVRWQGNLGWDNFRTFLIVHTIFIGFLLKGVFETPANNSVSYFIISIIGMVLCIPWLATKMRNHSYYIFRMAQARELEPDGWSYLKGKGKNFSDGQSVKIEEVCYRMPPLARMLKKSPALQILIWIFLIVYYFIMIYSLNKTVASFTR